MTKEPKHEHAQARAAEETPPPAASEPTHHTQIYPQSINEPPGEQAAAGEAPVITSLTPDTAAIGDLDFVLYVSGGPFDASSVIVFAGHDEPTTLEDDGTVSTGVNMAVWLGPDTVPCLVRNGSKISNELEFTFIPADIGSLARDGDPPHQHDERGHMRPGEHRRKR